MALVPYTRNDYLPMFHENSRSFKYANHTIEISQNWANSGVAGVVWDAALVLGTFLQNISTGNTKLLGLDTLQGKNVLELGAGTGLVGIIGYLLGANVVITDTKAAPEITRENVVKNLNEDGDRKNSWQVKELCWGKDLDKWKDTSWDLILGADIVYVQETFEELLETLKILTDSNKFTNVLLSCRIRYQRDLDFLKLLEKNFSVSEIFYDKDHDVKIYNALRH